MSHSWRIATIKTSGEEVTLLLSNWRRQIVAKYPKWDSKFIPTEICKLIELFRQFVANWPTNHPTIINTACQTYNLLKKKDTVNTSLILSTNTVSLYSKDEKSIKIKLLNGLWDYFEFGLLDKWSEKSINDVKDHTEITWTNGYWMSISRIHQYEPYNDVTTQIFQRPLQYKTNDILKVSVKNRIVTFEYNKTQVNDVKTNTSDWDFVFGIKLPKNSTVEVV